MGITHATVAVGTDAGTGEIHKAEWNADHAYVPAYLGYNTVGGSTQAMTAARTYATQITAGAGGNLLVGIQAYLKWSAEATAAVFWTLFADSGSDTIGDILMIGFGTPSIVLAHGTGGGVTFPARWLGGGFTYPLAASTKYWIGVTNAGGSGAPLLYKDGSGSDRYIDGGAGYYNDAAYNTGAQTNTSNKHSIRALVL